ncbi:hypothetical protein [Arthrobacter sp. zg-Y1110]|nr:hypothetical protein [Arthrobacter sp. zg-Y1110]MCC3289806.1 hypothetical protein [Arthrobacter sp. zg-Y1110]UWX84777.1 hypothetical protein N2K99_15185 [Arthrobacter sp. zg-Y1110]
MTAIRNPEGSKVLSASQSSKHNFSKDQSVRDEIRVEVPVGPRRQLKCV